jgi:hypothetical protein
MTIPDRGDMRHEALLEIARNGGVTEWDRLEAAYEAGVQTVAGELSEMREALQEAVRWERGPYAPLTKRVDVPAWVEHAEKLLAVVRAE